MPHGCRGAINHYYKFSDTKIHHSTSWNKTAISLLNYSTVAGYRISDIVGGIVVNNIMMSWSQDIHAPGAINNYYKFF